VDLSTYNPKNEKEFIKFGNLVATKFLTPVSDSPFFKAGQTKRTRVRRPPPAAPKRVKVFYLRIVYKQKNAEYVTGE
jgi:hypothetical protein